MSEQISILVTDKESLTLNLIKGLPEDAFYMLTQAKVEDGGICLKGSERTFSELLSTLYEEIEYQLSPKARLPHIRRVIGKIEDLWQSEF